MKSVLVAAVAALSLVGCGVSPESMETAEDGLGVSRELVNVSIDATQQPIVVKAGDGELMFVSKVEFAAKAANGGGSTSSAQDEHKCERCTCGPDGCVCEGCVAGDGGEPGPRPGGGGIPPDEEAEED